MLKSPMEFTDRPKIKFKRFHASLMLTSQANLKEFKFMPAQHFKLTLLWSSLYSYRTVLCVGVVAQ
jgi:hypothetical protein